MTCDDIGCVASRVGGRAGAGPPLKFDGTDAGLPLEFGAFCVLHGAHYRAYAQYRLRDAGAAGRAVRGALGELLLTWPAALASRPAAVGWHILRRRTAVALREQPAARADTLHRLVPAPAADAAVLHHALGLPAAGIADLMGCTPGQAQYWLLTFARRLAQCPDGVLRLALDEMHAARGAIRA